MWFWSFIVVGTVVIIVGAVVQDLFWWSMIATGVLWVVAVSAECIWSYRQEKASDRQRQRVSPAKPPASIAASERAPGQSAVGSKT